MLPRTTKVTKTPKKPTAYPSQHSPLSILPQFAATMLERDATICLFPFLADRLPALSPFHEGRDPRRQQTARGLLDERAAPRGHHGLIGSSLENISISVAALRRQARGREKIKVK